MQWEMTIEPSSTVKRSLLNQKMANFHVVEFLDEAEDGMKGPVAVIPGCWLLAFKDAGGHSLCNWPPQSLKADSSFILKNKKPDSSWPVHPVRLHKTLNDYKEASALCERLKDLSEVESDPHITPKRPKRPKITPIRFRGANESDSETEEEGQVFNNCVPHTPTSSSQYTLPPVPNSIAWQSPSDNSWREPLSTSSPYTLPSEPSSALQSQSSNWRVPSTTKDQRLGTRTKTHDTLEAKLLRITTRHMSLLEELRDDVKEMKDDIKRILYQKDGGRGQEGELPQGYSFPLIDADDVERLDWELKTDPGKRKRLVCHLGKLGGANLKLELRAILGALFSTKLARTYNFNGLKGKRGLKNHTSILQAIQEAARKHHPDATDADIKSQLSLWLTCYRMT